MSLITGSLINLADNSHLNEGLLSKLDLLKKVDFSQYSAGYHEINGDAFFFLNEYETKEIEDCFWEAHQKYLDIHFILKGKEKIAIDHIDHQNVKVEYNMEKDATIFEGDIHSVITMNPGDVMICFPEDSHMAGIIAEQKQHIRKVVLKVKL